MKTIFAFLIALLPISQFVSAQTREDFTLGGLSAFVIVPNTPAPGKPWIAYAPCVGGLPNWTGPGEEKWMMDQYFAAGIAVAGIYSGDLSGNPAQRAGYTALYAELVGNRGYAARFCFHTRSRGGLLGYNWAADNPGKVAAIGGIYPVTNLLSYPGENTAASHYDVSVAELNTNIALYNPIERLAPLYNAGVRLFHIHGDNDGPVPLSQNSQITKTRYDALGGTMTLKVIPGGGHDLSSYWFQDQDLTNFMITEALTAVSTPGPPILDTQTRVTPADGATNVTPSSNLAATFSESIALTGTGTILLKNLSGGADIPVSLTGDVSISGATLTINPASNLVHGQQYAVEISSDAIQDLATTPNAYAGLLASSTPNWTFTIQNLPPPPSVVNPSFEVDVIADGTFFFSSSPTGWTATTNAGYQDLASTENPQATDGENNGFANGGSSLSQLTSYTVAAGQTYTLTVDVGQHSNFSGSQATIRLFGGTQGLGTALSNSNGTAQLAGIAPAGGAYLTNLTITYTALASGDPFTGQQIGIALVGQSGTQVLFDNVRLAVTSDVSPPTLNTLTSVSPADGATEAPINSNLEAIFSEPIALTGTGAISLKNLSGGADIPVSLTGDVSISGATLTINPASNLVHGQQYAVEISSDAIQDLATTPNAYAGLLASSSPNWTFTIQNLPPPPSVVNPSFEVDVIADNTYFFSSPTGWTATTYAGYQDLTTIQNPQATDGENNGFANGGSSLSQLTSYTVAAGQTYTLTVDVGQISNFSGSQATLRLFGSTQGINTPLSNANGTAQMTGIAPAGGTYLTNRTISYTALASGDPFAGQQIGIALIGESGTQVLFDNVRFTVTAPSNTYSAWIAVYPGVGVQTGFNQDPDGDGVSNGVEAFFNSHPGVGNTGLTQVGKSGNTVSFQHPEGASPPSDVTGSYQWSLDLSSWNASGATAGGVTVAIPEPPAPSAGITTVTANITAGDPAILFLRVVATRP